MGALFGLPALVAGLVLLLAGQSWFTGAATVGWILTVCGGVGIALALLFFLFAAAVALKKF